MKKVVGLFLVILFILFAVSSQVSAQGKSPAAPIVNGSPKGSFVPPVGSAKPLLSPSPKLSPKPSGSPSEIQAKIRACQAKEEAIKTRSERLVDLSENMFAKFGAITTRTQEFYTKKGLTVSNYNTLVANITTAKKDVETALNNAGDSLDGFNCTASSDPKVQLVKFKENMQAVHSELKDYRKTVRDLIVAVHSVAKDN